MDKERKQLIKAKNTRQARRFIAAVLAFISLPLILPASLLGPTPQTKDIEPKALRIDTGNMPKIEPQIPKANRNAKHRVFLEKADELRRAETDSFMVVVGNVEFSHGPMLMFCDSAHFFPDTESLDAFGNVHMEQGDTLFVYADELNYRGDRQIAFLYGEENKPVRMINKDVTLRTPTFIYDLYNEYGYYTESGELTDDQNILVSQEGEYIPATKEANFYTNVELTSLNQNDTLKIYSDTLFYNTDTHIAELISPSTIISKDATINTSSGTYNTDNSIANLFKRSLVVTSTGTTLEGDTLFYDRNLGYGEAFGNMFITDSAHSVIFSGDYGFYDEKADSSFATGRALAKEYSQGDTLYMHGRYIYSFSVRDSVNVEADTINGIDAYTRVDTSYVMIAKPRVRFYRSDMQGLCDSMRFEQKDSILYMFYHPILWSDERQIFGNQINLHLNDSTIDRAHLPNSAFTAEWIEQNFYNQLAGKEMIAYFDGGELRKLDVNGNVQAIMLPQENDSTYNKIVNVESSFMTADFEKQAIQKMKMWPQTNGTVTPLYLAKKSLFFLPQFKWYGSMRPESPDDVFVIPPEMEELMADVPVSQPMYIRKHLELLNEPDPSDLSNLSENSDQPDQSDQSDQSEHSDQPEESDQPEKSEQSDQPDQSEQSEEPDQSNPSDLSEQSNTSDQPDQSEQPDIEP